MPSWLSSPFECAVLDIDSSVYPYYSIIVYIVIVQTHTINCNPHSKNRTVAVGSYARTSGMVGIDPKCTNNCPEN